MGIFCLIEVFEWKNCSNSIWNHRICWFRYASTIRTLTSLWVFIEFLVILIAFGRVQMPQKKATNSSIDKKKLAFERKMEIPFECLRNNHKQIDWKVIIVLVTIFSCYSVNVLSFWWKERKVNEMLAHFCWNVIPCNTKKGWVLKAVERFSINMNRKKGIFWLEYEAIHTKFNGWRNVISPQTVDIEPEYIKRQFHFFFEGWNTWAVSWRLNLIARLHHFFFQPELNRSFFLHR